MVKLAYTPAMRGMTHTAVIEFAARLSGLTPEGLAHFFFASGGSESNEVALKIVRFYWRSKGKEKDKIISLNNAYHGSTYGILGTTTVGQGAYWRNVGPLLPGFVHIPNFYCYRCSFGLEYPDCDTKCAWFLAEVIENEDTVGAFIAEPVQGSGGFIAPPPTYWPLVRQICTEHDILLIADEVITGFGRTGKMFAVEHWNVKPDILVMAKGITSGYVPLGAVAVSDEIFETLATSSSIFPHVFSYSGHPVCCAVAMKNMEIIVREKLAENAARVGKYILDRLGSEFMEFEHVGNISGLGLLCGIDLVADKTTKAKFDSAKGMGKHLVRRALDQGIKIAELGGPGGRIGISPPLTITLAEATQAIDRLKPIFADIGKLAA